MTATIDFSTIFDHLPGPCLILSNDLPHFSILAQNLAAMQCSCFAVPGDLEILTPALRKAAQEKHIVHSFYHNLSVSITPVTIAEEESGYFILQFCELPENWSGPDRQTLDLFMQAPVAICILQGPDYTIQLANPAVLEIWRKDETVIGKPLIEALPEIRDQGFIAQLNEVKISGKPLYANERVAILDRNGVMEKAYLNFVYTPFYDNHGTATGILAIASEVTAQVLARKKIEYAEETARLAIESAELGTYEVSLITNESITNERFNALWGYDAAVERSDFVNAVHPADKELRLKALEESVRSGKLFYETRVIWKDGSVHWIRVTGTVLFDAKHKPFRLIGVAQDITEQKGFTEQLNGLVQRKTAELQEANRGLERSNGELEQFAFITSHDLQEPLRKIQIFSDILLEKGLSGEGPVPYVEKINAAAKRMQGLIRELLEYARITQGKAQFRPVDFSKVLKEVLADFELLISQKKAILHIEPLATIVAIPLQINQLFYNLIGNALKFTRRNTVPVITVKGNKLNEAELQSFSQLIPGVDYYRVQISDNGIGFDQEYADKIFAVFQRLNQQSEYGGYGIGLALCSKVAINHHGIIFANSKPGEGATFSVILPYRQDQESK